MSSIPYNLLGLQVSGDLGPMTIYTNRHGKKVFFPKSPPKKPPSVAQIALRARFKSSQADYMALTDAEKLDYENLTKKTCIPMTGQNLWIHVSMTGDQSALDNLERQSDISVVTPIPHLF